MTTQLITSTTYLWRSLRGVRDEQDSSFKSLLELNVLDCWRLDSAGIPVAGGGAGRVQYRGVLCSTEYGHGGTALRTLPLEILFGRK